jgi:hypothetical protein
MLSALVQSQAAIVAIVITLTLIAVQLTASAYSPRVIDIFKKNPDMWILLGCYGFSIFYGFIVLKLVEGAEGEAVSQSAIWSLGSVSISLESCVSMAYWLGAFTFVALFPYMWNIISLLKPESIIKRLAVEITRGKILNLKEDPIQPIMDIIHSSIMKYDLETTRVGLKAVTDQVLEIIGPDDEVKISEHFCDLLTRVGRLAISRGDEESAVEVIGNFENFEKSTAENGLEGAASLAAKSLGEVGIAAVEKELKYATWDAAESLGEVGRATAKKGLDGATGQAARSLGTVGRAVVEKELAYVAWGVAESLGEVGRAAAKKGLEDATRQAAEFLGAIGEATAKKGLKDATRRATWSRRVDGSTVVIWGCIDVTSLAAWSLGEVGLVAAKKGLKNATKQTAKHLIDIGKAAAVEKGLEDATKQAAGSLAELTILNEEIVKTAIQNYKSELVKQDHVSFQKFMKIYEQELEKQRAKK